MSGSKLLEQIAQKDTDSEKIADKVIKQPEQISEILEGLGSDKASIKYGCAKILRIISDKQPELLYHTIEFFIDLLDNDNKLFQWEAIYAIANLASTDSQNEVEKIFEKYFSPITGPVMTTTATVIKGASKIALAKPKLTEKITHELLKVEKAEYETTECHNIVLGHTIKSFDRFFDQINEKEPVIKLVKKQLMNTRKATKKAAEKFVKKRQC